MWPRASPRSPLTVHRPGHAPDPGARSLATPFWPYLTAGISRGWAVPPYAGLRARASACLLDAVAGGAAVASSIFAAGIVASPARNAALGGAVMVVLGAAALGWAFS